MKILLLGKNGQLGRELNIQGKKLRHKVISFSHEDLDITDFKKTKRTIEKVNPDIVINATAYHVVADCEIYPEKVFLINAVAVKNLAEVTDSIGITFVHYGTDYVFDGKKGKPYVESDTPTPMQTYGVSKVAGENMSLAYNSHSIVIRSSGVYGGKHGSKSKKGNFAINILKDKDKKILEVSSEQIVNPTYAVDLAEATYKLLKHRGIHGIYHLVNEGYCSWAEFTQEIMKLVGSQTKVIPIDRRGQSGGARRPLFSALTNTRAAKLEVKLPTWQAAIKRYIMSLN